jgi:hypothetical protein
MPQAHVFALGGFVHVLVVIQRQPWQAISWPSSTKARQLGVALQGHADAKHGQRQAALLKLAQDAPHAGTRAVFVDALHAQVALRVAGRVEHLGQELLGAGVAMQHAFSPPSS